MDKNSLILSQIRLVHRIAKSQKRKYHYLNESLDEFVSAGFYGLVDAADRYCEEKGDFEKFASKRIWGEMRDYMRGVGKRQKFISLENHIDKFGDCEDNSLSYYDKSNNNFEDIIKCLPEKGQEVMRWHFLDNLTYKEIGEKLNVTEGRISQTFKDYKDLIRNHYTEQDFRELISK